MLAHESWDPGKNILPRITFFLNFGEINFGIGSDQYQCLDALAMKPTR